MTEPAEGALGGRPEMPTTAHTTQALFPSLPLPCSHHTTGTADKYCMASVASFRRKATQTVTIREDDRTVRSCSLGVGTLSILPRGTAIEGDHSHTSSSDERTRTTSTTSTNTTNMNVQPPDHVGQHPALNTVCVMDCMRKTRIVPNSDHAFPLSNDCFDGHVMLLMRTPDVDKTEAVGGGNGNNSDRSALGPVQRQVSDYFSGKKRRFEFQFQIKLKKVPTGPLFLGCELEHSIKVGGLTKTLVNLLLAMVRRINPGFHYSWGTAGDHHHTHNSEAAAQAILATGNYEKTHLSFPVEASMDRIVISKPGEIIPTLGGELDESDVSVKRRRKLGAGSVVWNTDDTYTMCLWSAYCDWIQWKSFNVPGVSPFALSRVTGAQPIYLCVYEITNLSSDEYKKLAKARHATPHKQKDLKIYSRLEFSNLEKTAGGYAETVLGRRIINSSDHSIPDTESVGSDVETMSRVSHVTN
jgi:Protein of unknown function (DUF1769)